MDYFLICLSAFLISIVTLFSGFGLGTVLMPVFAIFFPLPISIAATAIVHLANNLFKLAIVGKYAEKWTVLKFGIPAAIAAAIGAYLLQFFSALPPFFSYHLFSHLFHITWVNIVIGLIVILSAFFELIPKLSQLSFHQKYLILGGSLSGFFGGLSGNQGILRTAFLIKSGLNKEQFIGTGVICSVIVDLVRLLIYGWSVYSKKFFTLPPYMFKIIGAASMSAFIGAYIGSKLMKKITFQTVKLLIGALLLLLGIAILLGFTQ